MRTRLATALAAGCCLGLAACAAGPPKGPDVTVTAPAVSRPQPPASVQAALSREPFAPYAALGVSQEDGLAPGQSIFALATACMNAAGYPGASAGTVPIGISQGGPGGLSFGQPWGAWGYLGAVQARQYGFLVPPGSALTQLGVNRQAVDLRTLPKAEQAAAGKCGTIVQNFSNAMMAGPLAGIVTLSNDITSDVQRDKPVVAATRAWAACMTRNGFSFGSPQEVFHYEIRAIFGTGGIQIGSLDSVSSAARQAQIAVAVADSACTDSADLAGIYFAVQASYEQQLVSANQQALTDMVRRYRAAYARVLRRLPGLLGPAKASPFASGSTRPAR